MIKSKKGKVSMDGFGYEIIVDLANIFECLADDIGISDMKTMINESLDLSIKEIEKKNNNKDFKRIIKEVESIIKKYSI